MFIRAFATFSKLRKTTAFLAFLTMLVLFSAGLLNSTGSGTVHAGVNQWTTTGPDGGIVYSLLADTSTNPTGIYAGTYLGGAFKTTGGAAAWAAASNGLTNYLGLPRNVVVRALAIDSSTNPRTIYAGTEGAGVFKTSNGGTSWTALPAGPSNGFINSLGVDTTTKPSTIYAGTDFGAFRISGGSSWTPLNGLTDFVGGLAVDTTTNPSTIYAGSSQSGAFKLTSNTTTWTAFDSGLPYNTIGVACLAVDASTNPITIYAGTSAGVFKAFSGGAVWSGINSGLTFPFPESFAIDTSTSPSTLYTGTGNGGVFKLPGGSTTWVALNTGLTNLDVRAMAVDTSTTPSTVYAGTSGAGVFTTTSVATSWMSLNNGLRATLPQCLAIDTSTHPNTIYAGTFGGGVSKMTEGGTAWTAVNNGLTANNILSLAVDPKTSPSTIYAGTYFGGVFKTTNGGATWTSMSSGLTGDGGFISVPCLAVDTSTTPSTIYAGANGGAFRITNGGTSWTAINLGTGGSPECMAVDTSTSPNTIYAGTNFGAMKITSSETSWTSITNTGVTDFTTRAIAVDTRTSPSTIYAVFGTSGVSKISAGATGWTAFNTFYDDATAVAVDTTTSPSTIYRGSPFFGISKIASDGTAWTSINSGLVNESTFCLAVNTATNPATVYCGVAGAGVFQNEVVCETLTVGPGTIPPGQVGMPYTATTFSQTGGVGSITFNETGALPAGMTFSGGTLSGTPTQSGNFPITIAATDSNGCVGRRTYTLTVFDFCLQDDATGNMFQFNSSTGDYLFTRCGQFGFTMSGKGKMSTVNSILMLSDSKSDRRISAGFNLASRTGRAIVILINGGTYQTFSISQTNLHPTCVCPH